MLDRDPSEWATAVVGQGAATDGLSATTLLIYVVAEDPCTAVGEVPRTLPPCNKF